MNSNLRSAMLACLTILVVIAGMAHAADDGEGNLFGRLKAKVKENQPFQLLVRIKLKPGNEEKFAAEAAKAAKATAAEPGCESYSFHTDLEHPGTIILFERWKNVAALRAHISKPYIASLLKLIGEVAEEPTIQILSPLPVAEDDR